MEGTTAMFYVVFRLSYQVTVGAKDGQPYKYTANYRSQFVKAGVPVKDKLGSFLVSEEALPSVSDGERRNGGGYTGSRLARVSTFATSKLANT